MTEQDQMPDKGIYQRMTEEANRYSVLTPKSLEDLFKGMEESMKRRPMEPRPLELPASDYLGMSDELFKDMVTMKDVRFMGGSVGVNKMMARCKKLGIPVNERDL